MKRAVIRCNEGYAESMSTQCKDIADGPLVRFVADKQIELGTWVCVWDFEPPYSDPVSYTHLTLPTKA